MPVPNHAGPRTGSAHQQGSVQTDQGSWKCLGSTVTVPCCALPFRELRLGISQWGPQLDLVFSDTCFLSTLVQDPRIYFHINSAHSLLGCSENLAADITGWVGAGLVTAWPFPSAPEQFYPDKYQICLTLPAASNAIFPVFPLGGRRSVQIVDIHSKHVLLPSLLGAPWDARRSGISWDPWTNSK